MSDERSFAVSLTEQLLAAHSAPHGRRLADYFEQEYTGAYFETYVPTDPDDLEPADLVAVTLLSINISSRTDGSLTPSAILKLNSMREVVNARLAALPADVALHELSGRGYERILGPESHADILYRLLRHDAGLPRVATSKLLARKRPHLIPIRDSVTEGALGWKSEDSWWRPWWLALSDPAVVESAEALRQQAGPSARHLSVLRCADIALWMLHRRGSAADGKADDETR